MKPLQRKCLVASAATHGMLVLLLFVGSAFVPHKAPEIVETFEVVDLNAVLVDGNVVGGGNPRAGLPPDPVQPEPLPQAQPEPRVTPPAAQPEPEPIRQQPAPEPEPVREQPKPEPQVESPPPEAANDRIKQDNAKPKLKVEAPKRTFDLAAAQKTKISGSSRNREAARESESAAAEAQAAERAAAARRAALLAGVTGRIGSRIGDATEVGIPGPGGQAYMGYGIYLRKIYEDAWIPPTAARDNEPVVSVEVVIARDGTVLSSKVTRKAGNAALDRSVQETLRRVKKVRPFPDGATDETRTFQINFNLTSKLG